MSRRGFLRAGALLSMGGGGILATRASNAGAFESNGILEIDPVGEFGAQPSAGIVHGNRQLVELTEFNSVNESPGLIQRIHSTVPGSMAHSPIANLDGSTKAIDRHLRFRNSYGSVIWICIAFPDSVNCGGHLGEHATRGWWAIGLNQEVYVLKTQSRWVYYFAEAEDGAVWAGEDLSACVLRTSPFDNCKEHCLFGDRRVGMRGKTFYSDTLIVNLVR